MSALKAWRQVVTPHADIRQGKFDSSVFAANLGEVLAGRGPSITGTLRRSSPKRT